MWSLEDVKENVSMRKDSKIIKSRHKLQSSDKRCLEVIWMYFT